MRVSKLMAMGAGLLGLGFFVFFVNAADIFAAQPPPWLAPGELPLPAWVASARVLKGDQPIFKSPSHLAPRRGSAARDARLPIYALRSGAGCSGRWLMVGAFAWVCEDAVDLSKSSPEEVKAKAIRESPDGLLYRYYFIGPDGSFGYKRIEAADIGEPDWTFEPGFAVAIVEERLLGGVRYGRNYNDLWLPMRDLVPIRPFLFHGEEIAGGGAGAAESHAGPLGFGWVIADNARVRNKSGAFKNPVDMRLHFERVPVQGSVDAAAGKLFQIAEDSFLRAVDMRRPALSEPPPEVNAELGERWIDIDRNSQSLVAYEGRKAVFTTLVSTGKGREGSGTITPKGTFRIWIKLLSSDMDNLEDENAARYYRMETVPFVQYFSKGVGLHGAFWHRSFGRVRSHGCINLAPLDAQRLFFWTYPRLPSGWTAVTPTTHEPGTVIRIR